MKIKNEKVLLSALIVGWTIGILAIFMGGTWLYQNVQLNPFILIKTIGFTQTVVVTIAVFTTSSVLKTFDRSKIAIAYTSAGLCCFITVVSFPLFNDFLLTPYDFGLCAVSAIIGLTNVLVLNSKESEVANSETQPDCESGQLEGAK